MGFQGRSSQDCRGEFGVRKGSEGSYLFRLSASPSWVRYLSNSPSMGTDRRKTAQGNETPDDKEQPLKKRESAVSTNCFNKEQGSSRNVDFCSCAYMLVKLLMVDTAFIVPVSIPQALGQLSC